MSAGWLVHSGPGVASSTETAARLLEKLVESGASWGRRTRKGEGQIGGSLGVGTVGDRGPVRTGEPRARAWKRWKRGDCGGNVGCGWLAPRVPSALGARHGHTAWQPAPCQQSNLIPPRPCRGHAGPWCGGRQSVQGPIGLRQNGGRLDCGFCGLTK